MNCRMASSVACDVGLAAMEVEARAADDDDDEVVEERVDALEVGPASGRCRSRKRMFVPVRKSEMCEVWKRSIIF